jgi:cytochrome c-type biogenesis protein CcmF
MIPELGLFALIVAMLLGVVCGVLPLAGAALGIPGWIRSARPLARAQSGLVAMAFACLAVSMMTGDFSVGYVAVHSNSMLSSAFRFTAIWAGREGALLVWALLLTTWMLGMSVFSKRLPDAFVARVLGVMSGIDAGVLALVLWTSNPFVRLLPPAMEGGNVDPALQDLGAILHVPVLFAGFTGFSVAFAVAVSSLMSGTMNAMWARWARPWTLEAWALLTVGIVLGSDLAYREQGFGAWWSWDLIDNASFVPWLAGTALVHSLALTDRRSSCRAWTVVHGIGAFLLCVLGTVLVNAPGVVAWLHPLAIDPARGIVAIAIGSIIVAGALAWFGWRASRMERGAEAGSAFAPLSREAMLLANNVLLMVAAASILLGTLYPLALKVLGLARLSIDGSYFVAIVVPLMTPAIFLLGVGPVTQWQRANAPDLCARLGWAAGLSVVSAGSFCWFAGGWQPLVGLGVMLAVWCVAGTITAFCLQMGEQGGPWTTRAFHVPRGFYGMAVAHVGVGVFIVGVTLVKGYGFDAEATLYAGQSIDSGDTIFWLNNVKQIDSPDHSTTRAEIAITQSGQVVAVLYPEHVFDRVRGVNRTVAAIDRTTFRDLYVALRERDETTGNNPAAWNVRVQIKPFVAWIWAGSLLMALGGALAASDRRYRAAVKERQSARQAQRTLGAVPARSIMVRERRQ